MSDPTSRLFESTFRHVTDTGDEIEETRLHGAGGEGEAVKRRNIKGVDHVLCVALVEKSDPNGLPRVLRLVREDEQVRVDTPEVREFVTLWIPATNLKARD